MQKALLIVRKCEPVERAYHAPPTAWLGELIACRCGHGIGRHSTQGCGAYLGHRCPCGSGPSEVLDHAIRDAREECAFEAALTGT
jgi:hypothetical protein